MPNQEGFLDCFSELDDPRIDRKKRHPLGEILLLTLCGVICGCEGWGDIERFGRHKLSYLRRFLSYTNGVPSDDTLRRFFRAICPKQFRNGFIRWVKSFQLGLEAGVIAIDGKTSRHSFDQDKSALHLVSAFASETRLVLGQVATDAKSNEITAIPELLDLLDIKGALVSIDAMGCQHKIAQKIVDGGGNYLLALKGNQSTLHNDVITYFNQAKQNPIKPEMAQEYDKGHGRVECRTCAVISDVQWLKEAHPQWSNLNCIVRIDSQREMASDAEKETRYYISSASANAQTLLASTRNHWAIENQLHWVLDMSFGDDQSRIRKGNAPENIALIRHAALNMIRMAKGKRESIKLLRKAAGWDDQVLERIISRHF